MTTQLRAIALKPIASERTGFPFSVPAIRSLPTLDLTTPVTCFVGANGSGKSTLLEAIAAATRLPTVGSGEVESDVTLTAQRELGRALRLTWNSRNHRGFFLRAEDFFGFAKRLARMRAELVQRLDEVNEEFAGRSDHAKKLAKGPASGSLQDMAARYGEDFDARSHGESFLALFQSRFVPDGLYLLDEPEAALSPQSQLALLAMLGEMIGQNAQFIIASHSPILLAFPGARIYSFDSVPVAEVAYEDLEHVNLTRSFLNDPEQYIRHLFA